MRRLSLLLPLLYLLLLATVLALVAPAALAQDDGDGGGEEDAGESIGGTLVAVEGTERTPVEGVTITVSRDDEEIGNAESDETGRWDVPVPGPGTYQVRLDTDSLPDGIGLTRADAEELPNVVVQAGQDKIAVFQLGAGVVADTSRYERLGELVVLGLKLGAIIALSAVGLSLIFGVTGLVNFAHGEMVTVGAVVAYYFHLVGFSWPLLVAAIPAVLFGALYGGGQDLAIWRPLRRRRAGNIAMLVVSIGLSFAVRNTILIIFEGPPRTYRDFAVQDTIEVLGIPVVPKNLYIIAISVLILVAVGLFLQRTRTGIAMRAIADNRDLSESSGIDVQRVILATWIMAGALAALGGVFLGVSESVQYNMGFRLLLLIFAAVILGGLGTAYGAMLGGFIIGMAVELSTYWIDNELKNAVGLAVLVVMLLFRPQGLLGKRERFG